MSALLHSLVLLDFFVSDNDGLYTLLMLAAVGLAVVVIVMATRTSRQADRARQAAMQMAKTDAVDDPAAPAGSHE
jgi:response regulator of citrate/malate metabolism